MQTIQIPVKYIDTNKYRAIVTPDEWAEDPTEWGYFTIEQYNRDKIHHVHPDEHYTEAGKLKPNIQAKIRAGTAWPLEAYEHGAIRYNLSGEGMQCRFDTSSNIGIMFLNDTAGMSYEDRERLARSCIEEYSNWANGYVYNVRIERDTGLEVDSCSGIYEVHEYVKEVLGKDADYTIEDN